MFDKSKRDDGTFSRSDLRYDPNSDMYHCRKESGSEQRHRARGKTPLYRASKLDRDVCPLKPQCCPNEQLRMIPCDPPPQRERMKIEMRFANLKLRRLPLRDPRGAQDEFVLAAIAQNLRRLASLVARPPPARLCIA